MASGVFDLLHAGHLHYLEQAAKFGDELVVVIAHDDTVRRRKHEPVTPHEMRATLIQGMKPVSRTVVGNPLPEAMLDIVAEIKPDVIALGYDQTHEEERLRKKLDATGMKGIEVVRVEGLEGDIDGSTKIIEKIVGMWSAQRMLDKVESENNSKAK